MAKTIQDYLGLNASINGTNVTIDLSNLYDSLYPDSSSSWTFNGDVDEVVALIVSGLHARCQPVLDENEIDATPNTTALVAGIPYQPKSFVTRNNISQVQHEFVFNIYTIDDSDFNPTKVV